QLVTFNYQSLHSLSIPSSSEPGVLEVITPLLMSSFCQAMIQVTDKQLADIKKARYEFERDIVKPLREEKGVMVRPEKVIRYIEDRIKARDSLVEKLHLKNTALCAQTRKLQLQLLHKEDMEEVLHEVDFQQLRIENRQLIQDQNPLQRVRCLAHCSVFLLQKKLESLTSESKLLSSDIASHEDLLLKTDKETQQAEEERAKIEVQNKKLQAQLEDFSAPHVLEYMEARALHSQLEQSVKTWRRKIEVAEVRCGDTTHENVFQRYFCGCLRLF
uniref:Cilia- and flagella-associated protein 263 n=1 Tax=Electrophorus electricus TaxID=8005 RepID=A0A4W4GB82_ELEEL